MKALKLFTLLGLFILLVSSCGSSLQLANHSAGDDIYYNPQEVAAQVATNGNRVEMDSQTKRLIAETSQALGDTIYVESDSTGNPYQDVLADSYEKARRNRQIGMNDPWNGVSTNAYTSESLWYASAYDPSFYNIIVMGNTVWAEPKYVSAMFGYPYYSPYINFGAYYSPYNNYWNRTFGFGWGWYDSWWGYPYSNSWYAGCYYPSWSYPYYCGGGSHWYPSHGRYRDVVYGPRGSTGTANRYVNDRYPSRYGNISSNRPTSYDRNTVSTSRGSSTIRRESTTTSTVTSQRGTTSVRRPGNVAAGRPAGNNYTPTYSRPVRNSQSVFNDGNGTANSNSGYAPRRAVVSPRTEGASTNSSGSYRGGNSYTPSRNSNNTSTYTPTRTYSSPSSTPSSSSSNTNSSGGSTRGRR